MLRIEYYTLTDTKLCGTVCSFETLVLRATISLFFSQLMDGLNGMSLLSLFIKVCNDTEAVKNLLKTEIDGDSPQAHILTLLYLLENMPC